MDDMCHVRVLWLGCGTVRRHMEVAGDLEGERKVSYIRVAVQGGCVICAWHGAPTQSFTGTGTLACSISNCMTLKNSPLTKATGRCIWDNHSHRARGPVNCPRGAPDTEPGLQMTAVSAHLCRFEVGGSAVVRGAL